MMRVVGTLVWVELKLFLRDPMTVVFTLAFPPLCLVVLGAAFRNTAPDPKVWQGLAPLDFYVPAYIGLTLAAVGMVALPVHLAGYRERGVLRRYLASPVPVAALLVAQLAVALIVSVAGTAVLLTVGMTAYDVHAPRSLPGFALSYLVAALFFAALGFLFGSVLPNTRAAQGLGTLLFFVMMFLSGADGPRELFGSTLAAISDVLPLTHVVFALVDPWSGAGVNVAELTGITVATALAAALSTRTLLSGATSLPRFHHRGARQARR